MCKNSQAVKKISKEPEVIKVASTFNLSANNLARMIKNNFGLTPDVVRNYEGIVKKAKDGMDILNQLKRAYG